MAGALTCGLSAVMTADAVTGHPAVIESGRTPVTGVMTVIALITTGNMVRPLTDGDVPVVAADTAAQHMAVIDPAYR